MQVAVLGFFNIGNLVFREILLSLEQEGKLELRILASSYLYCVVVLASAK